MLVKCLICGKRYKVIHGNHLKRRHGTTKQEYLKRFPDAEMGNVGWSTVEKVCIDCGQPFRAYACNARHKKRCDICEKQHHRVQARTWWRRAGKYRREILHPFRHDHDKSMDLTVVNGRVNGALWLERQRGRRHKARRHDNLPYYRFLQNVGAKEYAHCCGGTLILIDDDRQAYCVECGGRIVKACENEHYGTTEFTCSSCGLVLEA